MEGVERHMRERRKWIHDNSKLENNKFGNDNLNKNRKKKWIKNGKE